MLLLARVALRVRLLRLLPHLLLIRLLRVTVRLGVVHVQQRTVPLLPDHLVLPKTRERLVTVLPLLTVAILARRPFPSQAEQKLLEQGAEDQPKRVVGQSLGLVVTVPLVTPIWKVVEDQERTVAPLKTLPMTIRLPVVFALSARVGVHEPEQPHWPEVVYPLLPSMVVLTKVRKRVLVILARFLLPSTRRPPERSW